MSPHDPSGGPAPGEVPAPRRPPARVRPPAVAGGFYPRDAPALRAAIDTCFDGPRGPGRLPRGPVPSSPQRTTVAGVVPHAGYVYSGAIAAHFFLPLASEPVPSTVLVLGVNHRGAGGLFTVTDETWRTPLGEVPSDLELVRALARGPVDIDPTAQRSEHSIEVELPFLQAIYGDRPFRFVGLQVTFTTFDLLEELGRHVRACLKGRDVLLLASSDFSHYVPPEVARRKDERALQAILQRSPRRLYDRVVEEDISMCGIAPTTALLCALEGERLSTTLLARGDSGEAEPMETVVGYAAIAFRRPAPA